MNEFGLRGRRVLLVLPWILYCFQTDRCLCFRIIMNPPLNMFTVTILKNYTSDYRGNILALVIMFEQEIVNKI